MWEAPSSVSTPEPYHQARGGEGEGHSRYYLFDAKNIPVHPPHPTQARHSTPHNGPTPTHTHTLTHAHVHAHAHVHTHTCITCMYGVVGGVRPQPQLTPTHLYLPTHPPTSTHPPTHPPMITQGCKALKCICVNLLNLNRNLLNHTT